MEQTLLRVSKNVEPLVCFLRTGIESHSLPSRDYTIQYHPIDIWVQNAVVSADV